jgi:perosamine synthetase
MISQMEPSFGEEEANACYEYMKSGYFVTEFHKTKEFEKMICDYTKAKHCIVTNNGTISLIMALMALEIKYGDEVIVPNFTMIASPNSIKMVGAIPVFVDIEEDTLTMDLGEVKKKVTRKTKAIMHVSMNTRSGNMDALVIFCKENGLYLISDAAQSLGSFKNEKNLGTYGDIGSFSFSPPKIISTGQGGCLVTDNDVLASKLRKIKDFGREKGGADYHDEFGLNFKFTDLQACIGIEQMKKLSYRVNRMKEMWNIYYSRLANHPKITMLEPNDDQWIPWFIDIYIDNRDELHDFLKQNNIGSRPVYPPCNSQKIYKEYNDMSFPVSEKWSKMGLWLPSSIKLTDEQINYICDKVLEFWNNS